MWQNRENVLTDYINYTVDNDSLFKTNSLQKIKKDELQNKTLM